MSRARQTARQSAGRDDEDTVWPATAEASFESAYADGIDQESLVTHASAVAWCRASGLDPDDPEHYVMGVEAIEAFDANRSHLVDGVAR